MKKIFTLLLVGFSAVGFSQTIARTQFANGFSGPVEIANAGDSRLFVVQQGGAIRILNADGSKNTTNFLTLSSLISAGGEGGLLGMAFHPDYANNGFFYVNYTNLSGDTVIARYTVSSNPDIADATSASILLTIEQPFSNHNGGTLKFGPDGFLYIGMGDGGSGNDPGNRAQNIDTNLGKMLRIDVNSGSPYGIPAGNPYVGIAGNDEIWAIGLRNPWKFSFNRTTGDLWIADVGQDAIEEINKVAAPLAPGLNFGWRCYEGTRPNITGGCAPIGSMTMPFAEYNHNTGGHSVTGGYAYTGSLYPNLQGKYLFADYYLNRIGMVDNITGTITYSASFSATNDNYTTFGEDHNGELYVAAARTGIIYKLSDTSLAVNNFNSMSFSVSPNPAASEITVKMTNAQFPAVAKIYDVAGKLLLNADVDSNNATLSTTALQSGMYIMNVTDHSGAHSTTKLMIQ